MNKLSTDIAIIGSGPGGYVAAVRAGQLGIQAICIEKDAPGGVCLNVGCIPSKAIISAAKQYNKLTHLDEMGITLKDPSINIGKMQVWKQSIVKKMNDGVRALIQGSGGKFLQGTATFIDAHTLQVQTKDGLQLIEAKSIIIATGSRPTQIPGFTVDNKRIHDSTGALAFSQTPKRLVVIGGGYIGLELGMAWAKLGSSVSVVEYTDQLLPGMDAEMVAVVQKKAQELGMSIYLKHKALRYEEKKNGLLTVFVGEDQGKGKEISIDCDQVLCAVGRRPNSEGLNLEKIGITCDAQGFIPVNLKQQTQVSHIYAIGDVCRQPMLAHKASKEADVAVEVIAGHDVSYNIVTIPAVVFTEPEIGSVGLTKAQAELQGHEVLVGKYGFASHARAMASLETSGFVKIVADAKTKQILGVHIVGPSATDLISEAALMLEMGAVLQDVAWTVHPHPTLGEALMEAAKAALGESPHVLKR